MKKRDKIALLVFAVMTVVIIVVAVIMLKAVSGDTLFYMDSRRGYIYALTYRWFLLAGLGCVVFWVLLAVVKRKAIAGGLTRSKSKAKPKTPAPTAAGGGDEAAGAAAGAGAVIAAGAGEADSRKTGGSAASNCASCGKPIPMNNKFCAFCGTPKDASSAKPTR